MPEHISVLIEQKQNTVYINARTTRYALRITLQK